MSSKEEHAAALQSDAARAAKAAYIVQGPKTTTRSATTPAYCFTALCPDPGLREPPEGVSRWRE